MFHKYFTRVESHVDWVSKSCVSKYKDEIQVSFNLVVQYIIVDYENFCIGWHLYTFSKNDVSSKTLFCFRVRV